MKRLIIVGSPRTSGRSAHLAEMLFEANIDEHPEDELFLVPVSEVEIGPCIGCNACRKKSGVIVKGDDGSEVTLQKHRCVFDDDMQTLYDLIDDVDEVTVVSPIYFSGAPAPMKCVLDRLQPYFWARVEVRESGAPLPEKRPLTLHVLGEGGDPHGYGALVSEVKSAFATADFRLERILDWVGKLDESGEITTEATEVDPKTYSRVVDAQAANGSAADEKTDNGKAVGGKVAGGRAANAETASVEAIGGKTTDVKASGTKTAGTKPNDAKTAGAKAAGTKAVDTKAADMKTTGTKTAGVNSAGAKTAGTRAAGGAKKARPKLDLHSSILESDSNPGESRKPSNSSSSAKRRQSTKGSATAPASGSRKSKGKRHGK